MYIELVLILTIHVLTTVWCQNAYSLWLRPELFEVQDWYSAIDLCIDFYICQPFDGVYGIDVSWNIEDNGNGYKYCAKSKCTFSYGQVVKIVVTVKFQGKDWVNPYFVLLDIDHIFLSVDYRRFYVCDCRGQLCAQPLGCTKTLKAGTYTMTTPAFIAPKRPANGAAFKSTLTVSMGLPGTNDYGNPYNDVVIQ